MTFVPESNNRGDWPRLVARTLSRAELDIKGKQDALGFTPVDAATVGVANGVASLDATGVVPAAQLPASGDPWTYVELASDFTTTATTDSTSTLAFTPAANTKYQFEAMLFLQTAVTTTGPQFGVTKPSAGIARYAAHSFVPTSQTANAIRNLSSSAAQAGANLNAVSTGLPYANEDLLGHVEGALITGASPTGDVAITLRSETAAVEVRIMAGSWLRYRTI